MASLLTVISIFGIGLDVDYKLALAILIAAQAVILLMFLTVVIILLRRAGKSIDAAMERSEAKRKERREKKKAEKVAKKVEKVAVTEETTVEKTKLTREEKKALKAEEKAKKKQAKLEAKERKRLEQEAKKEAKAKAKEEAKASKADKKVLRDEERRLREEERFAREEAERIRKEEERRKRDEEKRLAEEKKRLAEEEKRLAAEAAKAAAASAVVVAVTKDSEKPAEPVERKLLKISIETGIVQRRFSVGEEFNCDGLLVVAHYNLEPTEQAVLGHTVIEREEYMKLADVQKLIGAYVLKPNLDEEGIKAVVIRYGDRAAVYTIAVKQPVAAEPVATPEPVVVERVVEKVVEVPVKEEAPAPQPQVIETVVIGEESVEASRLRYDKSFEAKFIQSDDEVKHWYTEIKNCLLSYKGCKGRISWKRETFKAKKEVVAKLVFRGNTLCLFLPLNVADYADDKEVEDASNLPVYEETPVMIRIKNEKRKRLAITLIEKVMADRQILHGAHQSEDFYLPYEGVVELINRGLIKREIKTVEDEAIFERDKVDEE